MDFIWKNQKFLSAYVNYFILYAINGWCKIKKRQQCSSEQFSVYEVSGCMNFTSFIVRTLNPGSEHTILYMLIRSSKWTNNRCNSIKRSAVNCFGIDRIDQFKIKIFHYNLPIYMQSTINRRMPLLWL